MAALNLTDLSPPPILLCLFAYLAGCISCWRRRRLSTDVPDLDLNKFNAPPDWPLILTSKHVIGKPKCRIATRKRVSLANHSHTRSKAGTTRNADAKSMCQWQACCCALARVLQRYIFQITPNHEYTPGPV